MVFVIVAAFVETDNVCYSNGTDYQTAPLEDLTDVSAEFNKILWGLTITSALSTVIPLAATLHIGCFLLMPFTIFSDAAKVCTEHVLFYRGNFMGLYFWVVFAIVALVCVIACAACVRDCL